MAKSLSTQMNTHRDHSWSRQRQRTTTNASLYWRRIGSSSSRPSSLQACQSAQMNATAPGSSSSWGRSSSSGRRRADRGGVGAVLDGEQVARVVPRQRRQDRGRGPSRSSGSSAPRSRGPAALGPVEDDVGLAGADRVLVRRVRRGPRAVHSRPPIAAHGHEVVAEAALGSEPQVLGHRVDDRARGRRATSASRTSWSAAAASLVKMCSSPAASWARSSRSGQNVWLSAPEPTRKTRRSSRSIARPTHAPTARKSSVCAGLGDAHRHPALVALQEAEQVDGGVVDRAGTRRRSR